MNTLFTTNYESPVGILKITCNQDALTGLSFSLQHEENTSNHPILEKTIEQLDAYFAGERFVFTIPLQVVGTPFQISVWNTLQTISYGQMVSYQDIAIAIGNPRAVRAVGMANNRNPISIIIPCHRVIGKTGSLVGYAGGLETKQWLLSHESDFQSRI